MSNPVVRGKKTKKHISLHLLKRVMMVKMHMRLTESFNVVDYLDKSQIAQV